MKIQPDTFDGQVINAYGPGWVAINGERVAHSVVIGARGQRMEWHCADFSELSDTHFTRLAELDPELVIFGSGVRLRFPRPEWLLDLMARRIGVETMDTAAACRTYNILAGEGRNVIVALLLEQGL
ncbi:MAG: Mth938-like domain-containing protein [Comamonadaceae bacterium]|jgi:uncharacterized protein|nr:Mth938-like domain-containing protein [Comamonadaceae bacterium]